MDDTNKVYIALSFKKSMASRVARAREAYSSRDVAASRKAHLKEHIRHEAIVHGDDSGAYLGEFVYGAIDGAVTTFAVVAGATGAALSPLVVVALGFANLLADGFSMACGNFLSERAKNDYIARERKREEWEIEHVPDGEREEIKEIFRKKGFRGKNLDTAVKIITSDKTVWVDTMMADELGLVKDGRNPLRTAFATFIGFLSIGLIPLLAYLLSYVIPYFREHTFVSACVFTFCALVIVGAAKRRVTKKNTLISVIETVGIGGAAAVIAYFVGYLIRLLLGV